MMTKPVSDTATPRARSPLWLRLVLFASLAFNLLIIGIVVGALSRGGPVSSGFGGPQGSATGRLPFAAALDREDRREVGRSVYGEIRKTRPNRREVRASYAKAITLLRQDPFDAEAFTAHVQAHFDRQQTAASAGRQAILAHITQMTSEERRIYADRLEEVLKKGPRRDGRPKGPAKD